MSLSNISFVLGQGQIGQVAQNSDPVSGILFYGTAPGTFSGTATQAVFSIQDAENNGITLDYADETKPAATYLVTAVGANGDTVTFSVGEPNPLGLTKSVTLGTYTKVAGDTTTANVATGIAAAINALTYVHGYTASVVSSTVTITGRPGLGISLNTGTPFATVLSSGATIAGTLTQPSAATLGVYSKKAVWHYHVHRFFKRNSTGKLWISFVAAPSANYAEVTTLQQFTQGECRRIAVFDPTVTSASQLAANTTLLNTQAVGLLTAYMPVVVLYAPNIKAITDFSTLTNLQNLSNNNVQVCIGQDGAATGAQLFINSGISITCIGTMLGVSSAAAVSQDIGEVGAFNVVDDATEYATPAVSNGQLLSALSAGLQSQLDGYRYIFLTTYTNFAGTYFTNDWTAIVQTSDYYRGSRNYVMQKAIRGLYAGILPLLKSRIQLNTDGTLSTTSIAQFDTAAAPALIQMVQDGDLSSGMLVNGGLVNGVININPTQNVLSTGKLVMGIKLLPVGIADFIEVDIAFTPKL